MQNQEDGITAPEFKDLFADVKKVVTRLAELTEDFNHLPASEGQKEEMFGLLRQYNGGIAKLKQYNPDDAGDDELGFDYDPDELINQLGMTAEQETALTTVLTNELKTWLAKKKKVSIYEIELKLTHIKDVQVNYDYLTELVEQLLNQVHAGQTAAAKETQNKINQFAKGLEDRNYAQQIVNAAKAIVSGDYPDPNTKLSYPVKLKDSNATILAANNITLDRKFLDFRTKWGIADIWTSPQMRTLFSQHKYGQQDLDDRGQIRDLLAQAAGTYKQMAYDEKVQKLSKIKYRNGMREAIYELADKLNEGM